MRCVNSLLMELLAVLLACGSLSSVSSAAEVATQSKGTLELRPVLTGEVLHIATDEGLIELYRVDFVAASLDTVELQLVLIQNGAIAKLCDCSIGVSTSENGPVAGTAHIAMRRAKIQDEPTARVISCGLATATSRKHSLCKSIVVGQPTRLATIASPSRIVLLNQDEQGMTWAARWLSKSANRSTETVDELLRRDGFESLSREAIVQSTKDTNGSAVVFATIKGNTIGRP